MYKIYVLRSKTRDVLYKGMTTDLKRRLKEHNSDKCIGTRGKGPWEVVYTENCSSRAEARKREKELKSGYGRERLKELLSNIPL